MTKRLIDLIGGPDMQAARNIRDVEITGLTADSRTVAPGDLFAALKGAKADGLAHVPEALDRGAAALLVASDAIQRMAEVGVPVVADDNPRRAFALMAARFYTEQPETIVAVTGTNGKSSVAGFVRQLWARIGLKAASLGTLGLEAPGRAGGPSLTTPDPVSLHRMLSEMKTSGVEHVAIEASSHGLHQCRLDGVRLKAAAFTNLTRDHLDYHDTVDDYLAAKARLFDTVLPEGGTAVLNADVPEFDALAALCKRRRIPVLAYGRGGSDRRPALRVVGRKHTPQGQRLTIAVEGRVYVVDTPLVGDFQAANILCALGLAIASGIDAAKAVEAIPQLKGVRGRLERVATMPSGATVFVDYAHTPDALENVLRALRPAVHGKLWVVFGCGGDRDTGKRPIMGEIAQRLADRVVVTDDNPRSEDPAAIREAILAGCPEAEETGDRLAAIAETMNRLGRGDILVIAGKGHEQGQEIAGRKFPFDDATVAREAAVLLGGEGQ